MMIDYIRFLNGCSRRGNTIGYYGGLVEKEFIQAFCLLHGMLGK
jgi:hypothetical protein